MRFDAIELRRFGIFEELSLDLSQGGQGVHIVYGPNEAGKSTTLAALQYILYGFDQRKHDFYDQRDPRVGGIVRNGESTLAFLRKRGTKGALLSMDNKPLPGDPLAPFVGALPQDEFQNIYGLSHQQLTEGGRQIVRAQGDAGKSLFAAAGGLQDVQQLAQDLQSSYEDIFRARATTSPFMVVRADLQNARSREREASLSTNAFREREQRMQAAAGRCEALKRELEELTGRLEWLKRCREAFGFLTELTAVRNEIEAMEGIPPLRDGFRQEFQHALQEQSRAAKDMDAAQEKLTGLRVRLDALAVDTRFLEQAALIQELEDEAGGIRKALKDRAGLETEAAAGRDQVARVLDDIGRQDAAADPRAILPTAPERAAVTALAGDYSGLAARLENAERAREQAREALTRAEQVLDAAHEPADTTAVEAAVAKAQQHLVEAASLDEREQGILEQREQLEAGLMRLGRWRGALDAARTLAVPDEATILRFKDDFAEQERTRKQTGERREALEADRSRVAQNMAKLERGDAIPTGGELERLRERRDAAWAALRDAWLDGLKANALPKDVSAKVLKDADTDGFAGTDPLEGFPWRMQRADEAADRLRREADRVAEYAADKARLEQIGQELEAVVEALEKIEEQRAEYQAAWDATWAGPGIDHGTPEEMLAWRKKWEELVRGIEQHAADANDEARVRQRVEAARAGLMEAWRAVHPDASGHATADLGALTTAAGEWVKEARESRLASEQAAQECERLRETELPAAQAAADDADKAMKDWRKQWTRHMKSIGLPADALPREAAAMLEGLDDLKEALDNLSATERRIEQIDGGHERFRAKAAKGFKEAGFDPGGEPPEEAARTLNTLRERHARDDAERAGLSRQIEDEEVRKRDAKLRLDEADEVLQRLCAEAKVDGPEALPDAEVQAATLRALLARRDRLEEDIARVAMGEALEDFEERVRAEDAESLDARLASLEDERDRLKLDHDAAQQELGLARGELQAIDGKGDAARAAQDAADLQARALTLMEEYTRLALAHGMLDAAIRNYREKNQAPMLARAGHYFEALTLGSFRELRAGYTEKGEAVLLGARPDGAEIGVEGMSDGTADQLYLALRLAAIELRADEGTLMPLVLDDVLVNFDDKRAKAALAALGSLSTRTQVLMFTHHAHLVELAREALPEGVLFVHQLQANATGS